MKLSIYATLCACLLTQAPVLAQIQLRCKVVGEDRVGLPFATAYCKNTANGIAANESGELTISASAPTDTLLFSMMGYHSSKMIVRDVIKSECVVLLAPQTFEIEEVLVTPQEHYMSLFNGKTAGLNLVGRAGRILLVKIVSPTNTGDVISAIVAQIKKTNVAKHIPFILRARIYSINEDGLPGNDLLKETIRVIPEEGSSELRVGLSEYGINMPASGIFAGFEWLPLEQTKIANGSGIIPPIITTTKMIQEDLTLVGSLNGEWQYFTMEGAPMIMSKKNHNAKIGVEFIR